MHRLPLRSTLISRETQGVNHKTNSTGSRQPSLCFEPEDAGLRRRLFFTGQTRIIWTFFQITFLYSSLPLPFSTYIIAWELHWVITDCYHTARLWCRNGWNILLFQVVI